VYEFYNRCFFSLIIIISLRTILKRGESGIGTCMKMIIIVSQKGGLYAKNRYELKSEILETSLMGK
jgi:hypothetical protein